MRKPARQANRCRASRRSPAAAPGRAGHSRSRRSARRDRRESRRRPQAPSGPFEPGARQVRSRAASRGSWRCPPSPARARPRGPPAPWRRTCAGTGTRWWCAALELRQRVEVLVGQRLERALQHVERRADVDHHVSAVSVSRKKATSTTKVAPCSSCAGPKNGPEAVGDHDVVAHLDGVHAVSPARSASDSGRPGQAPARRARGCRGSSRGRSSKATSSVTSASSADRRREARAAFRAGAGASSAGGATARPGRPATRRASAGGCGRRRRAAPRTSASPYQLSSTTVASRPAQAMAQCRARPRWRWRGRRGRHRRGASSGCCEPAQPRRRGDVGARPDRRRPRDLGARQPRRERRRRAARPRRRRPPRSGRPARRRNPRPRSAPSPCWRRAPRAAPARPSGTRAQAVGRRDEEVLVRMQANTVRPTSSRRTLLDDPDGAIAVLDRERETRPPASAPACARSRFGGDPALEDQALGAAADAAEQRADERLAGARPGCSGALRSSARAAADIPERPGDAVLPFDGPVRSSELQPCRAQTASSEDCSG